MPQREATQWHGSQHAHAMAHATKESVLGDFNDASFDYFGVHSRFFRDGDKFMVETDGPDGKLAPFEVKYTFGLYPLQQYLVEFPDGRIQALSLAWDSRPKSEGGQRWFHLYPHEEITPRRRAALDQAQSELELHVRRVPLDRRAQELRRREGPLRHQLGRDQRRLRSVPRTGLGACGLGEGAAKLVALQGQRPSDKGLLVRFDERAGVTWGHDAKTGFPVRSASPADVAQGGRDLRALPCAARADSRKAGCPGGRSPTPISSRCSRKVSTRPTGRCSTRSIITAPSSRAGCMRQG